METFSVTLMLSDLVIACPPQAEILQFVYKKGDPNFRRDRQFYNYF
jgi:hypothetical protein